MKRLGLALAFSLALLVAPRAIAQDIIGRYISCSVWTAGRDLPPSLAFRTGTDGKTTTYTPKADQAGDVTMCVGGDMILYLLTFRNGNPTDMGMLSLAGLPVWY